MHKPLVVIFGGSGFVGTHLVRSLVKKGCMVKVLCRDAESGSHLKPLGDVGQVSVISADLNYAESFSHHLQGANVVINMVGILKQCSRQRFRILHNQMAGVLADMSSQKGVGRYIHMSALGVNSAKEDSSYAKSKYEGEENVRHFFEDATIIRPSVIFGPGDSFFSMFAKITSVLPVMPLAGGGSTCFQPVYVSDVAEVIARAVFDRDMIGKTYELGGPDRISLADIIDYIDGITGNSTAIITLPFPVMRAFAWLTGCLPGAPITADQVQLLRHHNVVDYNMPGFEELGIKPKSFKDIVPEYLKHFKKDAKSSIKKYQEVHGG